MILVITLSIIAAIVTGLIVAAYAPDVLGIEQREPKHRAEPKHLVKEVAR